MSRWLALARAALAVITVSAAQQTAAPAAVDAAFANFFQADGPQAAATASDQILASGVGFDEAFRRLRQGRPYRSDVARGVVQSSYRHESGEYFYTLDVPETYDPARKYQLRFQLHGGVDRNEDNRPREGGARGRLAGAEQIYVMPYAWRGAPWWSRRQTANLETILELVKRTYNVDENRVVLAGVSDGGTGAYYTAMRATTPFASIIPLNGFILVLKNETQEADGDLFPHNLVNKPMFIVNGGRDPQYPTSMVDPYVEHLRSGGVDLVYRPQPNAGHDTSWWPELRDTVERFVTEHPRRALPERLSWEAGEVPARAHWLIIDRLAPRRPDDVPLPDLNIRATPPAPDFGIRSSGARINRVITGSSAQQIGLKSGDIVAAMNNQPIAPGTDVAEVLRGFPAGRPLLLTVRRGSESVRLTGRYAPAVLPGEADVMFPRQGESGRVDVIRTANRVEISSRGVGAFTLLLSPDQFDFGSEVTVVVNGTTTFAGPVRRDLRTLLKWAARDNDRTMLFGAELTVDLTK